MYSYAKEGGKSTHSVALCILEHVCIVYKRSSDIRSLKKHNEVRVSFPKRMCVSFGHVNQFKYIATIKLYHGDGLGAKSNKLLGRITGIYENFEISKKNLSEKNNILSKKVMKK